MHAKEFAQLLYHVLQAFVSFPRIDGLLSMQEIENYYQEPDDDDTSIVLMDFQGAWHVTEKRKASAISTFYLFWQMFSNDFSMVS